MCQAHCFTGLEPDPAGGGPRWDLLVCKGKMYPGDQVAGTKKPRLIKNRGPVDSMTYSDLRRTSQKAGDVCPTHRTRMESSFSDSVCIAMCLTSLDVVHHRSVCRTLHVDDVWSG